MNIYGLASPFLVALIGLLAYRYRNRVGFKVVSIGLDVPSDNDEVKIAAMFGHIRAERLTIKNYGVRNLEAIELHFVVPTTPIAISVSKTSSISKQAVSTSWSDRVLIIKALNFPSSEEVEIELVRVGFYEDVRGRLKGTGGKYKIVDIETHDRWRSLLFLFATLAFVTVTPSVAGWLLSDKPADQAK